MFIFSFLLVASFCALYALGGQGHKWMKRFLAPLILSFGLLLTWLVSKDLNWLSFLGAILYCPLMLIFSYGEKFTQNKTWKKILFRGLCGLMPGICGLIIGIGFGDIFLGVLQLIIAVSGSICFGVINPFPTTWKNWATVAEDVCISMCYVSLITFMR